MQKLVTVTVQRGHSAGSGDFQIVEVLHDFLADGWEVKSMVPYGGGSGGEYEVIVGFAVLLEKASSEPG